MFALVLQFGLKPLQFRSHCTKNLPEAESGSKVDRFDPHMPGGLEWIRVDAMSVRSKCVYSAKFRGVFRGGRGGICPP